jgi:hypothetical protein
VAKLDLDIGAKVYCTDEDCGKLLKMVEDPHAQRVNDLIANRSGMEGRDT